MAKKITLKNKNGDTLCPHTAIEQVQGLKEALDGKLPLSGGTLTGYITAPSFKTNLTSGVAEAVMAYPVNISWSNDLNSDTYLKAGMYRTSSATSTVNQPNEKGHSNLLTIRGNESDNVAQMFFDYWNNGKVFTRVGSIAVDTTPTSHIFNRDWKQLRTIDDKVTTSHIADAAITPAKIQTSIALNGTPSMTVEPTTSSPDKTIASVGLVKEAVDGIEIGGVNLILNSDFSQGTEYWSIWKHGVGSFTVEDKIATFFFGATSGQGLLQTSLIYIESGQQYTMSFNVRSDNVSSINSCYLMSMEGVSNIRLTNIDGINSSWQRIEYHFTASQTGNYYFGLGLSNFPGGSFQIKRVKIEKGNKATDWSPAPEDIVNGIEIDTRNLISNGKRLIKGAEETDNWNYITIPIPVGAKIGDTFTFNCGKIENIQGSPTEYDVYLYDIVNNKEVAPIASITAENRAVTMTSVADAEGGNIAILLYLGKKGSTAGNEVYFYDCTLVKGNKPMLLWQPSVEEVQTKIDAKLPLSGGTLTGDLTAPSFKKNLTSGVAEAVMAYPVNISWGNDLNGETYLKAGMYQMSSKSNTLNQPSATGYGNVITVKGDAEVNKNNAGQIYLDSNGVSSKAYIRAGQVLSEALAGYHITDKTWREVRFMDDLVTTSHIADTAITSEKLAQSLILRGTPQLATQPTLSSESQNIASVGLVKKAVDGIEIDTRNLIPNSASIYTKVHATSNSFSKQILLPIGTKVGDTFVFNCDGIVNNQGSATEYSLLLFDWASQRAASNYLTLTAENRMGTFTVTRDVTAGSLYIFLYAGKNNSTAGNAVTYTNCTLVKGTKPMLLWQPSVEDVEAKIEAVKPTIFLQTLQPSATEVKEGDIWIIQ